MTKLKLEAMNAAVRLEHPRCIAVAFDDDGREVCRGAIEYADGEHLGIRTADGELLEHPMTLVRMEEAA